MTEFSFNKELREIFEKELLGKTTNAGRIYRRLRARDKEFIKKLKEEVTIVNMKETKIPFDLLKQRFIDNFLSCKDMKDLEKELQFIFDCCNIKEEIDKIVGEEL